MNKFSVIFIATVFLTAAAVLLLVDLPRGSLFWSAVQNSGHTLIFAILTLLSLLAFKLVKLPRFDILAGCVVFSIAIFGIAIEFIQSFMGGREASMNDVLLNTSGIAVGLLLFAAYGLRCKVRRFRWIMILLASGILLFNFRHPAVYATANMLEPALPMLADFEYLGAGIKAVALRDASVKIVRGEEIWSGNDSKILRVEFLSGLWPGVSLLEPHPDWTGFTKFVFKAVNPTSKTVEVTLRIHDAHHNNEVDDRFRRRLKIEPGEQTITIPIEQVRLRSGQKQTGRQIDMSKIKGIIIFMSHAKPNSIILLDNFHLE